MSIEEIAEQCAKEMGAAMPVYEDAGGNRNVFFSDAVARVFITRAIGLLPGAETHPWAKFLAARAECIDWLHGEEKKSDSEIAERLSMDPVQVRLIRARVRG